MATDSRNIVHVVPPRRLDTNRNLVVILRAANQVIMTQIGASDHPPTVLITA